MLPPVEDAAAETSKSHSNASASRERPSGSGGLPGIVARVKELQKSMPPEELDSVLSDGAKEYKDHLYGHPKAEG